MNLQKVGVGSPVFSMIPFYYNEGEPYEPIFTIRGIGNNIVYNIYTVNIALYTLYPIHYIGNLGSHGSPGVQHTGVTGKTGEPTPLFLGSFLGSLGSPNCKW